MELLKHGEGWVVMTFKDGSKQSVYTTLCLDIYKKYGITVRPGYFYDLVHNKYVAYRHDAVSIDVYKEKPEFDEEVLRFASAYI